MDPLKKSADIIPIRPPEPKFDPGPTFEDRAFDIVIIAIVAVVSLVLYCAITIK